VTTQNAAPDPVDRALHEARERYVNRRPRTRDQHERATRVLPGGNTRTVLYHGPFPLRVSHAWEAVVKDVDGHAYVDLLGEYSAGLYGHAHPEIVKAMTAAIEQGLSRSAHSEQEILLAEALCGRLPSLEQVRFTNSGTEANLMAVSAARVFTGRPRLLVFNGGYHGGLLTFRGGASRVNAPYDVVVTTYNDAEAACTLLRQHADSVAAVLVEPMLGASGCIPGDADFLQALRDTSRETGALLIFDEVMTSRTGAGGLQERLGVMPDLTTVGKYLGGGASFGAFGGRADVMSLFDPTRPDALPHAGTFNNNALSMAAGHAGLTRVYTPEVAEGHTARGDRLRHQLTRVIADAGATLQVTGIGSLMTLHPTRADIRRPEDLENVDARLRELLFLDLLEEGYYIAPRGYMALSLVLADEQLAGFVEVLSGVLAARQPIYSGRP
jgi:glutamate-1-semialdehyde 2,1-aminomutase